MAKKCPFPNFAADDDAHPERLVPGLPRGPGHPLRSGRDAGVQGVCGQVIVKNRNRAPYTFANINLLGRCNVDCFFCLGKDIAEVLSRHNQLTVPFWEWPNFIRFLEACREHGVAKLYVTGQNTDSLIYRYLGKLVDFLQEQGFTVGLRTNGYLALKQMPIIRRCRDEIGYSVHTLRPDVNKAIMGRADLPDWEHILRETPKCRVAIVLTEHNFAEFEDLVRWLAGFESVEYIQARRISTDTRYAQMKPHIDAYERLFADVSGRFPRMDDFYLAERFRMFGKEVCFWRTVQTSVNSLNYFTDGTVSDQYFVVEGYLANAKIDSGVIA